MRIEAGDVAVFDCEDAVDTTVLLVISTKLGSMSSLPYVVYVCLHPNSYVTETNRVEREEWHPRWRWLP